MRSLLSGDCAELEPALRQIHEHRYDAILIDDAVAGVHAIGDEFMAASRSRFVDMPSSERNRLGQWVKENAGLKPGEKTATGYSAPARSRLALIQILGVGEANPICIFF